MIYNNVTNNLRVWCDHMISRYADEYQLELSNSKSIQSTRYLSYKVLAEMKYKLGTLVDKSFADYETYIKAVIDLISLRIDITLKKDFNKVETYYIHSAEAAFLEYLRSLSPDCIEPSLPYCRIICGKEADKISKQIYDAWGYDATTYWYPLNGDASDEKLFISPKRIKPYMDKIRDLLGIPQNHIYEYGEAWYSSPHCAEVDDLEEYSASEFSYCPKDFSWIIYYSHENTVTFAGTIVPQIKEILSAEKEYWNCAEWDD